MIHTLSSNELNSVTELALKLWPHHTFEELKKEFNDILNDAQQCVYLYFIDQIAVGFAHVSLRVDYVEGTHSSPVGFLEGIFVLPDYRNQGIARNLLVACEQFAKSKGCSEFASDCELTNQDSILMHQCLGFEEMNRIVCFKKDII